MGNKDQHNFGLITIDSITANGNESTMSGIKIDNPTPEEMASLEALISRTHAVSSEDSSPSSLLHHFDNPADLKWEEVVIRVFSNEAVEVLLRAQRKRFTFAELGFKDGRKGDVPNRLWTLLHVMAEHQSIPANSSAGDFVKKAVSDLRGRLKDLFEIDDDPFAPYRSGAGWVPKLTITDARQGEGLTAEERRNSRDDNARDTAVSYEDIIREPYPYESDSPHSGYDDDLDDFKDAPYHIPDDPFDSYE